MLDFILRIILASSVIGIASLGELIDQRSGILNVGIEGLMLFGATFGFIAAKITGSFLTGFLAGTLMGGVLGLLHGFLSITLKVDQIVSGMGIWLLGFGLTTYIGQPYTGPLGMGRIPTIFGISPFVYVAVAFMIITWYVLFKTNLGLKIRSAGEDPRVVESSGISVTKTRYLCVTIGGLLGGFAGAIFGLHYNPVWSPNLIMGWGFVALALVFFSLWHPLILLAGSLLFGALWQLSVNPSVLFPDVMSTNLWRMVPYILTIVVLSVISTERFKTRFGLTKPDALAEPYIKEA